MLFKATAYTIDDPYVSGIVIEGRGTPQVVLPPVLGSGHQCWCLDERRLLYIQGQTLWHYDIASASFESTPIPDRIRLTNALLTRNQSALVDINRSGASIVHLSPTIEFDRVDSAFWTEDGSTSTGFVTYEALHAQNAELGVGWERVVALREHGQLGWPNVGTDHYESDDDILEGSFAVDGDTKHKAWKGGGTWRFDLRARQLSVTPWRIEGADARKLYAGRCPTRGNSLAVVVDNQRRKYSSGQKVSPLSIHDFALPEVADHRDIAYDGKKRFSINVGVWNASQPAELLRDVIVRMTTIDEVCGQEHPEKVCHTEMALEHEIACQTRPDLPLEEPTVSIGPRIGWLASDGKGVAVSVLGFKHVGDFCGVIWESSCSAFWITFEDGLFRRVSIDGALGPLISISGINLPTHIRSAKLSFPNPHRVRLTYGKWGHLEFSNAKAIGDQARIDLTPHDYALERYPDYHKLVQDAVDARTMTHIEMPDLSESSCRNAIVDTKLRIQAEFAQLIVRDTIRFRYVSPDRYLDEREFFDLIVANRFTAQDELRSLMETYCDRASGYEGEGPWCIGVEGIGALAFALDALVRIAPDDYGVLERYLAISDLSHGGYTVTILRRWIDERTVWSDEMCTFVLRYWDQPEVLHALLRQCESSVSPQRIAALMVAVLRETRDRDEPDVSLKLYTSSVMQILDKNVPYQRLIHGVLQAAE